LYVVIIWLVGTVRDECMYMRIRSVFFIFVLVKENGEKTYA
jgi:hypothetical protein